DAHKRTGRCSWHSEYAETANGKTDPSWVASRIQCLVRSTPSNTCDQCAPIGALAIKGVPWSGVFACASPVKSPSALHDVAKSFGVHSPVPAGFEWDPRGLQSSSFFQQPTTPRLWSKGFLQDLARIFRSQFFATQVVPRSSPLSYKAL